MTTTTVTRDGNYDGILVQIARGSTHIAYMSIDAFDCEYVADARTAGNNCVRGRTNQIVLDLMLSGF